MKNSKGFYIKSQNCKLAECKGLKKVAFRCSDKEARALSVEWHHGGSGIIAFFPKDENELNLVLNLKEKIRSFFIKNKKSAWEYLEKNNIADGIFEFPAKNGKYGYFTPTFGEPDVIFRINDEEIAYIIKNLI